MRLLKEAGILKFPAIPLLAFLSILGFSYDNAPIKEDIQRDALQGIDDCPYIFYEEDQVLVKWIEDGDVMEKRYDEKSFRKLKITSCEDFDPKYLRIMPKVSIDDRQAFTDVSKIAALSDIHGQYDLLISLLKAHKIIDEKRDWTFGKGHFVVTGDVFDRGDKVTETLWFLYKLEQQAEKAGGRVHLLLGNHEVMVLGGDLRYVSKKYQAVSAKMRVEYNELFNSKTLLGQWLRTKPVAITVNSIAFAHGGFSQKLVDQKLDIETTNRLFHEGILGKSKNAIAKDDTLKFLSKSDGPIWYRGYFRDEAFTGAKAQQILDAMNVSAIVVGHTSYDSVLQHYDGRIYSVDSSIKKGEYGEVLIWEKNEFFRGTLSGELRAF